MKNKKGFTLIELLAVIVVLAIIALIATPIVMNTIKKSQKGAAERSVENYIEALETAVATAKLDGKDVLDGTYTIEGNGNLIGEGLPDGKLTIEMNGKKPSGGTIKISNGQVTTDSKMTVGSYEVAYNPTTKKYEASEKSNDTNTVLCKANTTKATALVYGDTGSETEESSYTRQEVGLLASEATSAYDVGVTYTCELGDGEENTFYVLETSGDNVSLIAGFNLGDAVAWVTKEDYLAAGGTEVDWNKECKDCGSGNLGPVTANKALQERTSGWTKINQNQKSLPTYNQIATASGNNTNNLPTWLNSHTKFISGSSKYWTTSLIDPDSHGVWGVLRSGNAGILVGFNITYDIDCGIRPVITISKSQLG